MQPLDARSLPALAGSVSVPTYDRSRVRVGIVHLGVGGFHRSHQAMYVDRLLEQGQAQDWGICGVGVLPSDRRMAEVMAAQQGLYTLVVKHTDGTLDARVVGSIVEYLLAPDDPESVVERMAAATTRIVSLTVTEGGYNVSAVSGEFDATAPEVVGDLRPGAALRSTFGLVTEALVRRRDRGLAPFTVLSCDNIEHNGDVARRSFAAFAALRDPELGAWVDREVPFPNSMVDRITPATTDEDRADVARRSGVEDRWPVVCEPFTQWVLEDRFGLGRPPLEDAGVQVVDDVEPYERMKLRLLNAGHQALAYLGRLAGHELVHDAVTDPLLARLLLGYLEHEATPTLLPVPGIDLDDYRRTLVARFANPHIRDTLARLAVDGSERLPKWLLPVVRENLASGGEVRRSAAVVAGWARFAEGVDEQGQPIEVVDRRRDTLVAGARRQREDPLAFLADRELFGDLVDDERFTRHYRAVLGSLHERGTRATLEALVDSLPAPSSSPDSTPP
ncbi:mannitol dehydrogenase family protein [Geodermatophilus sabuli]|uniref:Mannitol-1-phosphate 5-dehydrogenase n=1 Tax=Geodermatophilus sabuli TaxID=1564158 RepID=A0A7K3VXY5_9ACTN|nr:mannitol dehydrogenase family protein [Geodermatophilus sabuli]NEK56734.1 mannitol dehydrogenase family protein [Geodermatophilus sabuli]